MNTFNAFNDYIQAILASGLAPDKAAELIDSFIYYRKLVKAEVKNAEVMADNLREIMTEYHVRNRELNEENSVLTAKVCNLEKELAEARAADANTIRFNTGEAFDKARFMEHRFIDFIKWLRNEAIVISDGTPVGLYEAKLIAEFIYAYFGFKEALMPGSTPGCKVITEADSTREDVLENIVVLLKAKYPGYKLVDLGATLWD